MDLVEERLELLAADFVLFFLRPPAGARAARMGLARSVASAHRGPSSPVALRTIFMSPRRAPGSPCLPLLDKKLRNWASWDALWGIWA